MVGHAVSVFEKLYPGFAFLLGPGPGMFHFRKLLIRAAPSEAPRCGLDEAAEVRLPEAC
jgi:hypothetical protein